MDISYIWCVKPDIIVIVSFPAESSEQTSQESDKPPSPVSQEESAATAPPSASAAARKAGMKLSYDDYKHMANLLVIYMRKREEEAGQIPFVCLGLLL